ncbi:MAG: four helix bundle protein [Bacteroidetes bacterium]|nr:MAG: four helix bundle protein [Bacteroidota bacterium]
MVNEKRNKREMLEDRLIDFAIKVNQLLEELPHNYFGNNLSSQLARSSTSPALNYGEAQASESTKDFIHKMKVVLKELRETYVGIKIIERGELVKDKVLLSKVKIEANELISIFVASINTATRRL